MMSNAYKCDKCGILYKKSEQRISVPFKKSKLGQSYIQVVVAKAFNLCDECVGVALDKAGKIHTRNS